MYEATPAPTQQRRRFSLRASVLFRAYAKINLILSVSAPKPADSDKPGFHEIASWFACIDLHDELTITPLAAGAPNEFNVRWSADAPRGTAIDWPAEKDLAFRAHRLLESHIGKSLPARLDLVKRIPVGGGLGGGSSDAAAALVGLNQTFGLGLSLEQLASLGSQLGSDVPYFVCDAGESAAPAIVRGFGQKIERMSRIESGVLLVVPPFGCPTGPVYKAYDSLLADRAINEPTRREAIANETLLRKRLGKVRASIEKELGFPSDLLFNDLGLAAYRVEPRLGRLATNLGNALREPVHVTGSGSCLFVICPKGKVEAMTQKARATVAAVEPGSVCIATQLL
ncbi:MAG: 4-(cytidine 5'-diphospho)-2-C-methyl-D-erythritol kinase [Planctomycetes bacterium]|nr:4-(cytidine 5'-diphospho)-2-C-methyl-D-erythritol kinase [Planctomycetota bacterium]